MKTKILITAVASCFMLHSAFGQGALTPPGTPTPTMKSLDQIEPRTPITNTASTVVITQPGSYYLTGNLTVSTGTAGIVINTNGVTLDLNGFTISTTDPGNGSVAIEFATGWSDITICNGHIVGGVTDNGSGVYSGGGFGGGIVNNIYNNPLENVLVSRITVSGCLYDGINLGAGISTVVENCTVQTVGGEGILASTIKSCSALDCGSDAINGDQVSDCRGQSSGYGYGVYATATAQNCYGATLGANFGLLATTALNCYGTNTSFMGLAANTAENCYGHGYDGGITATTALNCFGISQAYIGLQAYGTAENCYGLCGNGDGLDANTAQNCQGQSYSNGSGINAAFTALNCYGVAYTGDGIDAHSAQNCYGISTITNYYYSNYDYGISADTAENCYGNSSGGIGISCNTAQNCYGVSSGTYFGAGLFAGIASGCYGDGGTTAFGLTAHIASVCSGASAYGAVSADFNVNSH